MNSPSQFQLDFEDFLGLLPQPTPLRKGEIPPQSESCFISILGFEPRCCAASSQLATMRWTANPVICVHYAQHDMLAVNNQHRDELYQALNQINDGADPIPLKHDDHDLQVDFGDQLLKKLSAEGLDIHSKDTQIVLDITAGSSRLLIEGLHALLTSGVSLTLLYSEATDYRPSFEEYKQYVEEFRQHRIPAPEFLTIGIEKVELLKRIPGCNADPRPTYLVAFPSFTPTRIGAVIEELSPSRVYWLFGMPHLVKNRWRIDAQRDYHLRLQEHLHRHCYVSTFDYRETLAVLEGIYGNLKGEYGILVCSLGSKLQKVGQVLFHILRPAVGAVVSVPRIWDPERRSDDNPREIYSVPLGDCTKLRERLRMTTTLRL